MTKPRRIYAVGVITGVVAVSALAACGGDDFENRPRPPVALQLTGVIGERKVTISPATVGAGPIVLIVSNQTEESHTVTLDGPSGTEEVGPINPLDTGRIQHNLEQGSYQVKAGSSKAVEREIDPAVLTVGPKRESSSNSVLLP